MTTAEVDGVPFEQPDLLLGEHDGIALGMLLQTHQSLVAGLDAVTLPHAANTARARKLLRQVDT
jgi:hypothetical protein